MRENDRTLASVRHSLAAMFGTDSLRERFEARLTAYFPQLFALLHDLYGDHVDFDHHLGKMMQTAAHAFINRPESLKQLDEDRSAEWFQEQRLVGAMVYVDRYATNLAGIREQIPYFKELGITYLHLMPLFRCPPVQNDGGYAVSSFREVRPDLGTMDDFFALANELRAEGISPVLDFVMNHTADDHDWALRAKAGDAIAQSYYFLFPDRTLPDAYEKNLREVFPEQAPGNFTYITEVRSWAWTTFNHYQWDLNYANPAVFTAMLGEMLFLANQGVEVLRLDAVPFIWKQLGTNCENLPQAHDILAAYRLFIRMVAPAMIFKSEAIVHPDEVKRYIGDECQISYNPLLMVLLWEAVATSETRLLQYSMHHRFALPQGTAWVNYIRSHDDIGWGFANEDCAAIGLDGPTLRTHLNEFYTGKTPASFARGLPFNYNPRTGDMRISGTTASLAGLEAALLTEDVQATNLAISRIVLLIGFTLATRGIPLLYLGDEVGTLNDYSYQYDTKTAADSRWVHRPHRQPALLTQRYDAMTAPGSLFQHLQGMIQLHTQHAALAANGATHWLATENPHIIMCLHEHPTDPILIIANFAASPQTVRLNNTTSSLNMYTQGKDLQSSHTVSLDAAIPLVPYALLWLALGDTTPAAVL